MKSKNEFRESPKRVTISNLTLTFQGEKCFQTTLTPIKSEESISKVMSHESTKETMTDLPNYSLKATESRSVAWGNTVGIGGCSLRIQMCVCFPVTQAFVSEDSQTNAN